MKHQTMNLTLTLPSSVRNISTSIRELILINLLRHAILPLMIKLSQKSTSASIYLKPRSFKNSDLLKHSFLLISISISIRTIGSAVPMTQGGQQQGEFHQARR